MSLFDLGVALNLSGLAALGVVMFQPSFGRRGTITGAIITLTLLATFSLFSANRIHLFGADAVQYGYALSTLGVSYTLIRYLRSPHE